MSNEFKPGDLVIFIKGGLIGKKAAIISDRMRSEYTNDMFCYDIHILDDGRRGRFYEDYLELEKPRDWGDGE